MVHDKAHYTENKNRLIKLCYRGNLGDKCRAIIYFSIVSYLNPTKVIFETKYIRTKIKMAAAMFVTGMRCHLCKIAHNLNNLRNYSAAYRFKQVEKVHRTQSSTRNFMTQTGISIFLL